MNRLLLFSLTLFYAAVSMADLLDFAIPEAKSGYEFLSQEMRDIQDDDFLNPGMQAVDAGREHYLDRGDEDNGCADCHGKEGEKLAPASLAAYPKFDAHYNRLMTLQDRIHACWTDRLDRFPMMYDEKKLVELETFIRHLAQGQTIAVKQDEAATEWFELGKSLYNKRFGQMGMTCQHCHVIYQGRFMRGNRLTQGQSNGFPVYRFKSDKVTSLHKRFDECFVQLRATPYEKGSREYKALEYYMAILSNGLKVETPGVRF